MSLDLHISELELVTVLDKNTVILAGRTPVTRYLWAKVMEYTGVRRFFHRMGGKDNMPMNNRNYHEVNEFLVRLSHYMNYEFRLPTWDEWMALASERTVYPGSDNLDHVGWYVENSKKLMPVARKSISRKGFYDLAGNVHEMILPPGRHNTVQCLGGSFKSNRARCKPGVPGYSVCKDTSDEEVGFRIIAIGA